MNIFLKCYERLNELMPKSLFKVARNSIIYSCESSYEPSQELDIACHHSTPIYDEEISI